MPSGPAKVHRAGQRARHAIMQKRALFRSADNSVTTPGECGINAFYSSVVQPRQASAGSFAMIDAASWKALTL
jgi:hypothetical protein